MNILAVDTATKNCSVALVCGKHLVAEMNLEKNQTHSIHLMDMIEAVMHISGLAFSEIDGFAVSRGPGSFTGIRIGISVVKGLAAASEKPVVGISSLDALAFQQLNSRKLICPVMDARKGEVYMSRYRSIDGKLKKEIDEMVLPPEKAVTGIDEPCLFTGEGSEVYKDIIMDALGELAGFSDSTHLYPCASAVAYMSLNEFDHQHVDDIECFVPTYIRKPDAEIQWRKV